MVLTTWQFTVTRQSRWHDGIQIVEISQGGIDYCNPDALCEKYGGEFQTYTGMAEAVEVAISIAESWKKDTKKKIHIGVGCTHGFTLPLDEMPTTKKTYALLRKKAKEFDEKLPHCAQCGDLLTKDRYRPEWADEDDNCCSEYCCEKRFFSQEEEE